jgi:hypothetical protein
VSGRATDSPLGRGHCAFRLEQPGCRRLGLIARAITMVARHAFFCFRAANPLGGSVQQRFGLAENLLRGL